MSPPSVPPRVGDDARAGVADPAVVRGRRRRWEVLLVGGAAGTGKTRVASRPARHVGVGMTQVDDFQVVLERMTTPEQQPALHVWGTHPDPGSLSATAIQAQGLDILQVMPPALEAVVGNHLEEGVPTVLEGDFIHPSLAAQERFDEEANGGRVRGVFLYEEDVEQLVRNVAEREPAAGLQTKRAEVSALWARWFRAECAARGVTALPARPWDTLFARTVASLEQSD